ncbi:MAG: hypothetical protein CM15mP122_5600 [Bacteroidota bacterium]|nr:MAG: hypothetical protein CM15mP122_5600 [Bacteroidota bacterium]
MKLFYYSKQKYSMATANGWSKIKKVGRSKQALNAIMNDTTLTTGAYFGFGHWNAGEQPGRRAPRGGQFCHRNDGCQYYGGWGGVDTSLPLKPHKW